MRKALLATVVTVLAPAFLLAACTSDATSRDQNLSVTISGEGAALTGFSFPPASRNDLAFVDGWDVRFERILVTVDQIVLTEDPDTSPTDQSATGPVVARATGPWAVDMTRPGTPTTIQPRAALAPLGGDHGHAGEPEGETTAQSLVQLRSLDGNRAFDPSRRYGFGFDIVPASATAKHTNLDAGGDADYADMIAKGLTVLYVGTATFKGQDCKTGGAYDFTALPRVVKFRFGFRTPTQYANCQNTSLRGKPFDGEEAQRGVQVSSGGMTTAQITLHVDHPFWNTVDHDAAELYFDQIAAAASPDATVVLDDLAKVDFTSFKDRAGKDLPWRSCVADKPAKTGTRRFDSGSVPVDPTAAPNAALRSYADFVSYQQSTQGHLNADGLCAVKRNFAAPR